MRTHVPVNRHPNGELQSFERDWFGLPDPFQTQFRLSLWDESLCFEYWSLKNAECDETNRSGEFVEGLWEKDVAEFFVMGPDGRYQEFNLSPTGAWWSATFTGYREGCQPVAAPSVRTEAEREQDRWSARLWVAPSDILVLGGATDLTEASINVCSILAPRDPIYLCWGWQKGNQPDFHRAENFLPTGS